MSSGRTWDTRSAPEEIGRCGTFEVTWFEEFETMLGVERPWQANPETVDLRRPRPIGRSTRIAMHLEILVTKCRGNRS